MTYYHGTVSTFQASILKYGLYKGGDIWYRLAKLGGSPGNFGQSAVWCCDSFEVAVAYARHGAIIVRAKQGEMIPIPASSYVQQYRPVVKTSPFRDPNAYPIVFAIEIDESEAILSSPGKFRVLRAIPPEALTLVRGSR